MPEHAPRICAERGHAAGPIDGEDRIANRRGGAERASVPRFIRTDGGIVNKATAPGYLWLGDHLLI